MKVLLICLRRLVEVYREVFWWDSFFFSEWWIFLPRWVKQDSLTIWLINTCSPLKFVYSYSTQVWLLKLCRFRDVSEGRVAIVYPSNSAVCSCKPISFIHQKDSFAFIAGKHLLAFCQQSSHFQLFWIICCWHSLGYPKIASPNAGGHFFSLDLLLILFRLCRSSTVSGRLHVLRFPIDFAFFIYFSSSLFQFSSLLF